MGIDINLTIPAPARIRDVADVTAMLLGCPGTLRALGGGGICNDVAGITFMPGSAHPECAVFVIDTPDGPRHFLYHYEWDALGNHGMMLRSTAANIALAVGICDFFGGSVDFNDCDDVESNYRQPVREDIHASDDQPWDAFQRRMNAVRPITPSDIARYTAEAAYR